MSTELRNVLKEEFKKSLMGRVFDIFLREFTKNNEGVPYNFNILDIKKITELYVKNSIYLGYRKRQREITRKFNQLVQCEKIKEIDNPLI